MSRLQSTDNDTPSRQRPSVLIVAFSQLHTDPRVLRQIQSLSGDFETHTLGLSDPASGLPGMAGSVSSHKTLKQPRRMSKPRQLQKLFRILARRYDQLYWGEQLTSEAAEWAKGKSFDLVIGNDVETLPLAISIAGASGKVVFDAHEFAPLQYDEKLAWRLLFKRYNQYLCRSYIPHTDKAITVGPAIAEEYQRRYQTEFHVVTNAPRFEDHSPTEPHRPIRLVHHGAAMPGRKLEDMIEMAAVLGPEFHLTLHLMPSNQRYMKRLRDHAAVAGNTTIKSPVPFAEISRTLNQHDVGVYLLDARSFNMKYCLPNKLFEFVQARLAIAVGPSPEMARVVEQYGLGGVSSSFEPRAMAETIRGMCEQGLERFKEASHQAAYELSADQGSLKQYRRICLDALQAERAAADGADGAL